MNDIIKYIANWRNKFKKQRLSLLGNLLAQNKSPKEILGYFYYYNMQKKEEDFCPLYKRNELCHKTKTLNCYGCDCPFYEPSLYKEEDGNFKIGRCLEQSKKAIYTKHSKKEDLSILDCSKCTLPHTRAFTIEFIKKDITSITKELQEQE